MRNTANGCWRVNKLAFRTVLVPAFAVREENVRDGVDRSFLCGALGTSAGVRNKRRADPPLVVAALKVAWKTTPEQEN